jgi:flagellar biosynthetic protein FliP
MITLTLISLAPSLLIMTTCFLRMIIVLSFLRQAMGTQQTPPNSILLSLALILTLFVMTPTWQRVNDVAITPYRKNAISWDTAVQRGSKPISEYLLRQTRQKDMALALRLSRTTPPKTPADAPFTVLLTAYILSELKTAFEIGFIVFIPFLVVDIVVASVLMSLGMMMVPPTVVSLPLKILLFVMVDGWSLLVEGLVRSVH